jgi:peptidoglycan/xylan/chitin deacetylase (PgdA/CDA1 family)
MWVGRWQLALCALGGGLCAPAVVGGSDMAGGPVAGPPAALAGADDAAQPGRPIEPRPLVASSDVPEPGTPFASPGHGPHVPFRVVSAPREVLLSFDDGPDLRGTPLILDELDRRGLKAIFFVTGWRLKGDRPEDVARRDLVRRIAAHGHLVANHTMSHHNLCQNPGEQANEIDENAALIAATTGVRPFLFRSPYGAFCRSLEATLQARGLVDIGWNLDPQDWKVDRDEEYVYSYLTRKLTQLKGRGILLLHDTHLASVHALPRLLDWMARENSREVRAGRPPITITDYRALVPGRDLAAASLPQLVGALVADAAGSVQRHLR